MSHRSRTSAAATMMAGALAAAALAAAPAQARVVTGDTEGLNPAEISCVAGSLTVTKPAANPYDDVPAGELPPGLVSGATFSLHPIKGVDLSTEDGWRDLDDLEAESISEDRLGEERTAVTGGGGQATFEDLEPGAYLVTEQERESDEYSFRSAAPFIVTVPTGAPDGSGWVCDVAVVAKNKPEGPAPTPPAEETTPPAPEPSESENPGDGEPGEPPSPEKPGNEGPGREFLANTGVGLIGLVLLAAGAVAAGFLLRSVSRPQS